MRLLTLNDEVAEVTRGEPRPIAIPAPIGLHPQRKALKRTAIGQARARSEAAAGQLSGQVVGDFLKARPIGRFPVVVRLDGAWLHA